MNTMVIGIAGGTGSGKTTVTEKLQEYFGADIIMLQGGHNLVALDMLIERIRSHIGQEI